MNTNIVICGYGWLGNYLGRFLVNNDSTCNVVGTTRSQDKAATFQSIGVTPVIYALGADSAPLCQHLNDTTLVLNIPPGRRRTDLGTFIDDMKQLIDDALVARVKHIVFISTTSVYGDSVNGEITETSQTAPETASGKAHVEIENHLLTVAERKTTIVRLAGLMGPDRHPIRSLAGKSLDRGNKPINLVEVNDVVLALNAVFEMGPQGKIYHLCSTMHPKRGDYYTHMANAKELTPPTFTDTHLPMEGKVINAKASWEALGISPKYATPFDVA